MQKKLKNILWYLFVAFLGLCFNAFCLYLFGGIRLDVLIQSILNWSLVSIFCFAFSWYLIVNNKEYWGYIFVWLSVTIFFASIYASIYYLSPAKYNIDYKLYDDKLLEEVRKIESDLDKTILIKKYSIATKNNIEKVTDSYQKINNSNSEDTSVSLYIMDSVILKISKTQEIIKVDKGFINSSSINVSFHDLINTSNDWKKSNNVLFDFSENKEFVLINNELEDIF